MSSTWNEALNVYHAQHFTVLTREDLFTSSLDTLLGSIPVPLPTLRLLEHLSQPYLGPGEAFFRSIQSVHGEGHELFPPLKDMIERVTQVAILYGEAFAWKSPDKWSYLLQVRDLFESNTHHFLLAHAPATLEQIQQAETLLGMLLPPQYIGFLQGTNGVGLALEEQRYICGVGDARAAWDEAVTSLSPEYHEITRYWRRWHDVLAYERERDRETGITTFISDERICVPFAYTIDDWCFDRSRPTAEGEYPVLFWDHELREATPQYADFESWFVDIVINGVERT